MEKKASANSLLTLPLFWKNLKRVVATDGDASENDTIDDSRSGNAAKGGDKTATLNLNLSQKIRAIFFAPEGPVAAPVPTPVPPAPAAPVAAARPRLPPLVLPPPDQPLPNASDFTAHSFPVVVRRRRKRSTSFSPPFPLPFGQTRYPSSEKAHSRQHRPSVRALLEDPTHNHHGDNKRPAALLFFI
jgi:hypothetical protein